MSLAHISYASFQIQMS